MYSPENETFSKARAPRDRTYYGRRQSALYYLFHRAYLHLVYLVIKIKEEIEDT
jgi:hypothetical protein